MSQTGCILRTRFSCKELKYQPHIIANEHKISTINETKACKYISFASQLFLVLSMPFHTLVLTKINHRKLGSQCYLITVRKAQSLQGKLWGVLCEKVVVGVELIMVY